MRYVGWILLLAVTACKKPPEEVAPIVGWHQEEGWMGSCYYPPDYASLSEGERRMARNKSLEMMKLQWRGDRSDGVRFSDRTVDLLDDVLLARPEKIEAVSTTNLQHCQTTMASGSGVGWGNWLDSLPAQLTAGECKRPLDYTLYDYLDIGRGWQREASVCRGDPVRIKGSTLDEYRVTDGGPWITVVGDRSQETLGDYPCTQEGCYLGQLVMRFTGDSGVRVILPVGDELIFTPPEHGVIEVSINDNTWYDNVYRVVAGIEHHTSIEYSPVEN